MFDTTMFDLEADGSGEDRCDACGSGPHRCWMYLQMMRVACCERCSHQHDALLAREVCFEWEEFSEDRCKCRECEAWRKRRDSCPCENCRDWRNWRDAELDKYDIELTGGG